MFELTGYFNGEYVEEKVVGARQLIEHFNLEMLKDKKRLVVELDANAAGTYSRNRSVNNNHAVQRMLHPLITGSYNGDQYFIRYYKTKVPRTDRGVTSFNYSPKRVSFRGSSEVIDLQGPDADLERAVFLSLCPSTSMSPFHSRGNSPMYLFKDREKDMETALMREQIIDNVTSMILEEKSGQRLQRIAKGITLPGNVRLDSTKTESGDAARLALLNLARKNPALVIDSFNDDGVYATGVAFHAIDSGLIKVVNLGGGRQAWRWTDTGGEVLKIDPGVAPRYALEQWIKQPANFAAFINRTGSDKEDVNAPAGVDFDDLSDRDLIELAYEHKMVFLDRKKNRVYQLDGNGQVSNKALVVLKGEPDGWMDEAANNLNSPVGKSLIKELRTKFQ